jgi:hypothetical protein
LDATGINRPVKYKTKIARRFQFPNHSMIGGARPMNNQNEILFIKNFGLNSGNLPASKANNNGKNPMAIHLALQPE